MLEHSHAWAESLPDYAERIYASARVESACLELQDRYGINVNILLWVLWLEHENIALATMWLDDILITIDTTSQLTTNRLREVRNTVKTQENFTRVQKKLITKAILAAELSIERILLQRLQDSTSRFLDAKVASGPNTETLSLKYYLSFMGVDNIQDYRLALQECQAVMC